MQYQRFEEQYLRDIVRIIEHGHLIENDRTGVGTRMLTGMTWKANLQNEFPLPTSKWVGLMDVFAELKVFIRGSTNNNDFLAQGCKIWNEWAAEDGMLGPIYSAMWRRRPAATVFYEKRGLLSEEILSNYAHLEQNYQTQIPPDSDIYFDSDARIKEAYIHIQNMAKATNKRFYKPWLWFVNFKKDFFTLPGCETYIASPHLIPSTHGHVTNAIGPDTLMFIPPEYEKMYPVIEESPFICSPVFFIDQLKNVMNDLRKGSTSRRMIVDCWDPSVLPLDGVPPNKQPALGRQALACCHDHFQFHYIPPQSKLELPRLSITATLR